MFSEEEEKVKMETKLDVAVFTAGIFTFRKVLWVPPPAPPPPRTAPRVLRTLGAEGSLGSFRLWGGLSLPPRPARFSLSALLFVCSPAGASGLLSLRGCLVLSATAF